ncbi:DUF1360 domain-containing protein [Ferruginibacter sp.]
MLLKIDPGNALWLLISILVVWRLTTLICYEAGPFNCITKLRWLFYKLKMGSLIECFHCAAVWLSMLTIITVYHMEWKSIFLIFAVAGGASIIEKITLYFSTIKQDTDHEQ